MNTPAARQFRLINQTSSDISVLDLALIHGSTQLQLRLETDSFFSLPDSHSFPTLHISHICKTVATITLTFLVFHLLILLLVIIFQCYYCSCVYYPLSLGCCFVFLSSRIRLSFVISMFSYFYSIFVHMHTYLHTLAHTHSLEHILADT